MNPTNPGVDNYLLQGCGRCAFGGTPDCKVHGWTAELSILRKIILDCGLKEELKWSVPTYTLDGKNVLMLSAFRDDCVLSFFKGSLIEDHKGILVKPGKHSQASRMIKVRSVTQIMKIQKEIKDCIIKAIDVEKRGLKVQFKKTPEPIPEELQIKFNEDPVLKSAFDSLTPGRQRGYIIYFSAPKQSKTRVSRIEKYTGKILNGEGMHDEYRRNRRK